MSGVMNEDLIKEREDLEWLDARERGEAVLPPIDPQRAESYQRIQSTLAELPEMAAPEGWQGAIYDELDRLEAEERGEKAPTTRSSVKVMLADDSGVVERAKLAEEERLEARQTAVAEKQPLLEEERGIAPIASGKKPKRRLGQWISGAATLGVAATALLWLSVSRRSTEGPETLAESARPQMTVVASAGDPRPTRSGASPGTADVGSILVSEFVTESPGVLRLYRNDKEVVAQCLGSEGCELLSKGKWQTFKLQFKTATSGEYRAVFFKGAAMGEPRGSLDEDLKHCDGCEPQLASPTKVR